MDKLTSFRIIPPNDRGYQGLTALKLNGTRELVAMGTGIEVERVLRERVSRGRSQTL